MSPSDIDGRQSDDATIALPMLMKEDALKELARKPNVWQPNKLERLKIAVVHSFYSAKQPSGENVVVERQIEALRKAGHEVELFSLSTDELEKDGLYALRSAFVVATGVGPSPDFGNFIPDVVHVHNLFPNFGKRWIRQSGFPLVTSLHNYRPMCAAGTFYRDGNVCVECLDAHSSLPALRYGCYRSQVATVPVALGQHFEDEEQLRHADQIIVLSQQMSETLESIGIPKKKLVEVPHFLPEAPIAENRQREGWLYVGRLSEEKGILELLKTWPAEEPLEIVGSGPLESEAVKLAAGKNVSFLGRLPHDILMVRLARARGLVFPSRCFETFGLSYIEALSVGTPVLAWEPSVVASFVRADGTGIVMNEQLVSDALGEARSRFPKLEAHCRRVFVERYTESSWISSMMAIYERAIELHRHRIRD